MNGTGSDLAAAGSGNLSAVIELGTTSVRMVIAQFVDGSIRTLDSLQQPVTLGKDTFTQGFIGRTTTEQCVRALRSFRKILDEYAIDSNEAIEAVATSAVREAANSEAFLDRIFIATGLDVRVLDETETNRVTYLAVHWIFQQEDFFKNRDALVVEVGGGSTQAILLRKGQVGHSHTYRLGSLRLRQMLEDFSAPVTERRQLTENQITNVVEQIVHDLPPKGRRCMLALGGEVRFAMGYIQKTSGESNLTKLNVADLAGFADRILDLSIEEVVRKYHVSYPEAETLGLGLLVYVRLAESLNLRSMLVGRASLRDGLLQEKNTGLSWTAEFKSQIYNSALDIGRKYDFEEKHSEHVQNLSLKLFEVLKPEHHLGERYEIILTVAALLHDIGMFISNRSHHKHSMYLILNCDIFGMSARDLMLTALVARYHRKAMPRTSHPHYMDLQRKDRVVVLKLAAILRVADALDRGHMQRRRDLNIRFEEGKMIIEIPNAGDLTMEQHGLREKGQMFRQVYGMDVILLGTGKGEEKWTEVYS